MRNAPAMALTLLLVGCGPRPPVNNPETEIGAATCDLPPLLPPYRQAVTWPHAPSPLPVSLSSPPDGLFPNGPVKYQPLNIPGTISYPLGSGNLAIIDAYGWLTGDSHQCNGDPDWEYELEIDPERSPVDLNALYRVGSIVSMGYQASSSSSYRQLLVTPRVHVEVRGWNRCPAIDVAQYGWTAQHNCGLLPFDPEVAPDGARRYVHITGALITDEPHVGGKDNPGALPNAHDWDDVKRMWSGCGWTCPGGGTHAGWAVDNPARWTEIHSPDLIEPAAEPSQRTVTVRAVVLSADHGLFSGMTERIDADMFPCPDDPTRPCPAPPGMTAAVKEYVDGVTNFRTITDGDCDAGGCKGARLTLFPDHVHVVAQVHGEGGDGAPGKLKALYRVLWCACGCDGTCAIPGTNDRARCAVPASCPAGSQCSGGACVACSDEQRRQHCGNLCNRSDGCGGTCACAAGTTCFTLPFVGGECVSCGCTACGRSPFGCACPNTCPANAPDCAADGSCTCTPKCAGKCNGEPDGCGATCPRCPSGQQCANGACVVACPAGTSFCDALGRCASCCPGCDGTTCGSDNCGGQCRCARGQLCRDGACVTHCPAGTRDCGDGTCITSKAQCP